jgi:two-component sensor histidine kinase
MRSKSSLWFWRVVWGSVFVIILGLYALYAWLPADGATGDMESFRPDGYRVQWILEERPNGLQVGDVVVRGGGHTFEEWLAGAPRGAEWRAGGVVTYEILRDGQPMSLDIHLEPVPLHAIVRHWGLQLLVALSFFVIGSLVFWKRPQEPGARVLMLFCATIALQYWGDAYNFQYATLPWRWPFAIQLAYELVFYGIGLAAICHFVLVFPLTHPVMERFPRRVLLAIYAGHPVVVFGSMALAPNWGAALIIGSGVSWALAILYIGSGIAFGLRAVRVADDPVARAQISWILWCAAVGCAILVPGYMLPLMLTSRPLIPHPVTMLIIALIPFTLAIAVLRFHLFDIDVIINRTLVYGTLTLLLAGLYFLIVWGLTSLIELVWQGDNSTLVVFVAALGIALAFDPLRRRVQHLINLTFYRARLDYERLLPEMSERLATSLVLDKLAALLTVELPRRLQIEWAALAVLAGDNARFVPTGQRKQLPTLPVDHALATYLHRSGKPLLRLQPPADLPAEALAFLERYGVDLSIPLTVGDRLLGIYNLGAKLSGRAHNRDETRLLHLLGRQAAVAVENSRLFQAEREQRQLTQALREAADVVSRTLDLDQVLDHILEQVEQVVEGQAFNVMLVEGDQVHVVRWRGYEALGLGESIARLSIPMTRYPSLSRMVETGRPVVVPDTANNPDWVPREGWEWQRSYVAAPILVAGQTIGFLNVDRSRLTEFGQADAEKLEALARHAATALEHARLYERAQQEIAERRRAEAKIKASLAEKEVLLKEIHHRVKNNLQVISSLLYLQSKRIQDRDTLAMFQDSQHRVRSMALVHERLYQAQDLSRVDAADYIRTLARYLFRSYEVRAGKIELAVDIDDVPLGIDAAVPCGLIVNELVSNSLKHAFSPEQEGRITIALNRRDNGDYALVVGDDGVGFPAGVDFRHTDSLGLQLVTALVDQLEGTIKLDARAGTRFEITFPASGRRGGEVT